MRDYLLYILCAAGVTAAGYLVNIGSHVLKTKLLREKGEAEAEGKMAQAKAFEVAENIVSIVAATTVEKIEQTKAKDLRILVKDGKIDKSELTALADEAYDEIIATVKDDVLETLRTGIEDIDRYIRNQIEAKVLEVKAGTPQALELFTSDDLKGVL